jgi:hypothetical protein
VTRRNFSLIDINGVGFMEEHIDKTGVLLLDVLLDGAGNGNIG